MLENEETLAVHIFEVVKDTDSVSVGDGIIVFDLCDTTFNNPAHADVYAEHVFIIIIIRNKNKEAQRDKATGKWLWEHCKPVPNSKISTEIKKFLSSTIHPLAQAYRRCQQEQFIARQRHRLSEDKIRQKLQKLAGPDEPLAYP